MIHLLVKPDPNESPGSYADRLGIVYSLDISSAQKKNAGQYFTPLSVAQFMSRFCTLQKKKLKILDPGCGTGILSCCLIEELVNKNKLLQEIDLVAFETDSNLLGYTDACLEYLGEWLRVRNIKFNYFLCKNDFVLHNSTVLDEKKRPAELYDAIIANPPYFKINKEDLRAVAAKSVIHGQTNIYSIFMLIAAKLLNNRGQFIFITPRSFSSGSYFKVFREKFFSLIAISDIHLFVSRKEAFKRDKILQENIIVSGGKKSDTPKKNMQLLKISTTTGIADIESSRSGKYYFTDLVNLHSDQKILHIPVSENDEKAIKIFKSWKGTLKDYQLEISTGPVVDFRNTEFITAKKVKESVPLIYLANIKKMDFTWPAPYAGRGKIKGQFISCNKNSQSRLVANKDYILLRRFSSKDDHSRLIASPYKSEWLPGYAVLGIENHLNYIYRPEGTLQPTELYGMAALLNSRLFDIYFRTFNGNINVSATELRHLPLPDQELIKKIGKKIIAEKKTEQDFIDDIIQQEFNIDLN